MHILLGLLGAVGTLLFILWRINMAVQATRELSDAAGDAKGLIRGFLWRRKFNADPLKQVEDPREAAAVMMVAVAEADGALSERERLKIISIIMEKFDASQKVAEEFLTQARWLSKDAGDLTSFLNRLKPIIQQRCDQTQKVELIQMLRDVCEADGSMDPVILDSIDRLKRNLM